MYAYYKKRKTQNSRYSLNVEDVAISCFFFMVWGWWSTMDELYNEFGV